MHKAVTGRVEAKKLLSRRRQSEYVSGDLLVFKQKSLLISMICIPKQT